MKTSIEIHFDHLLIMQDFLKILKDHRVFFYSGNPEDELISEKEQIERERKLDKFRGSLAKYSDNYQPQKGEFYE